MEIIRADTDYAIRLLVQLALTPSSVPVTAKTLAGAEQVPEALSRKILQKLAHAGLILRKMGARGGFQLARDPGEITLMEAATAIQGPLIIRKCALGKPACPRQPSCLVSSKLQRLQSDFATSLKAITLKDIIEPGSPPTGPAGSRKSPLDSNKAERGGRTPPSNKGQQSIVRRKVVEDALQSMRTNSKGNRVHQSRHLRQE